MSITVHPIFTEEIKLPFVVYGIGTQEEQCSIHRPKGFPMDQLIFSKKGSGILQNIHGTYEINQGEYAYLKPHEPHSYRSMGAPWSTDWLLFKGNNSTPALESLNFNKSKIDSYVEDPKITSLFYDIISTLQGSDPLGNYSASSLLYQLLVLLYQNFQSNHGKEASLDRQIMEPVMEYIKRNFIRTITLNDLAQIAKVTPQHLCTVFKGSMKMRPMEYITRKRLQESKRMLLETDLPVKEIAESVGYIDNNYFGVLFKKQEGITPGQYRGNNPSQDSLSTY